MVKTTKRPSAPRCGLRERKKAQTRRLLVETAARLFQQAGFDAVTVAQIADAANVSVKTLFVYFASKEDLVFGGDDEFRDEIVGCLRARRVGQSPVDALEAFLRERMGPERRGSVVDALDGLGKITDHPSIKARMRLLWANVEHAVADELAKETAAPARDPRPQIAAAQLLAILRGIASEELRVSLRAKKPKDVQSALASWLDASTALVRDGLGTYARKPKPKA